MLLQPDDAEPKVLLRIELLWRWLGAGVVLSISVRGLVGTFSVKGRSPCPKPDTRLA